MAESISQEDVESAIKNLGIELRKAIDDALDRKLDDALLDQRERACFRLLVEERAKEAGEKLDEDRRKLRGQIAWWGSVAVVMLSLWEIAGCPRMVELVRAQVSEHFASEQVKRILSSYTNEKLSGLIDTEMSIRFPIVESNVSSFVEERVSEIARREAEVEKGWERANQQMDVVMKSASARSGSRKAYDELISIARSTNELSKTAQIAISEIQERYKREKYGLSFGQGLKTNDGGVVTSDAMEEIIRADNAELGAGAISMLGRSKDTSGVATLVWSVQNSAYLEFVYLSIRSIENLVKTNFPPLGVEDALSWWKDNLNKEEYHSYYSRYLDCSWGTNGIPSEEVVWKKIDLLYETRRLISDEVFGAQRTGNFFSILFSEDFLALLSTYIRKYRMGVQYMLSLMGSNASRLF